MPRRKIQVTEKDLQALEALTVNPLEDSRVVERASIVLACLRDEPLDAIADRFQVSRSMIFRWRSRYLQEGPAGLWDKPRTGKPPRYDDAFEKQVLKLLQSPPPEGRSNWDGVCLAKALGSSPDAVWRVLRRRGMALARHRVWSVRAHIPQTGKARRIAGVYISPSAWMIALRPAHGRLSASRVITRHKAAGEALKAADRQEGILTLQQVMQIMGQSRGNDVSASRKKEEILYFLDDMMQGLKAGEKLTVQVLGDASALEIGSWMAAHQEVSFSFYGDIHDVKRYLDECVEKKWITRDYARLFWQILEYPRSAPSFIWLRDDRARV